MNPIKIAMAGTGFGAKVALPVYLDAQEFEPVAVWSHRAQRAREVAELFKLPIATGDMDELLSVPGLEAVHVATPVPLHVDVAEMAAARGLHVLCEKPLASDMADADRIAAAVRAAGVVGVVDFELRHRESRRRLLDQARQVGRARLISMSLVHADHSTESSRPFTWASDASMGGGRLQAYGVHDIDLLLQIATVQEVCAGTDIGVRARLASDGTRHEVTAEDAYAVVARLTGGGLAVLSLVATAVHRRGDRIEVYGDSGTALLGEDGVLWSGGPDAPLKQEGPFADDLESAFRHVAIKFHAAVRLGNAPEPSLEDGLRAQAVLDAIRSSAAGAGWVRPDTINS